MSKADETTSHCWLSGSAAQLAALAVLGGFVELLRVGCAVAISAAADGAIGASQGMLLAFDEASPTATAVTASGRRLKALFYFSLPRSCISVT